MILNADDSDLDPLVYDWDLARDVQFANLVDSGIDEPATAAQTTTFRVFGDLSEDTRYCWRVRADDGQATSTYSVACFLVTERNDPPSVPTLGNPSDQAITTTATPTFSWAPSTDPEDEAITYDIDVRTAAGEPVGSVAGVSGTVTSISTELADGATYTWRARATDRSGASSDWSPVNTFTVALPVDPRDECCNSDGGCRTSTPAGDGGGALAFAGLALGLGTLRRRRRAHGAG